MRPRAGLHPRHRGVGLGIGLGVLSCALLHFGIASAQPAAEVRRETIDLDRPWTPYAFEIISSEFPGHEFDERRGTPYAVYDVDGDGNDDRFVATSTGLKRVAIRALMSPVLWQIQFPGRFHRVDPMELAAGIATGFDVNGDDRPDLVAITCTPDLSEWLLLVVDALEGHTLHECSLPIGPDRNESGKWEGGYAFIGAIDDDEGPGKLLVLVRTVDKDAIPRGLVAIDPRTGEVRWEYVVAVGAVPHAVVSGDFDGDGHPEFAIGGGAVANLDGLQVDGISDDECWVHVVDTNGQGIWKKRMGGVGYFASPRILPRDGGGHDVVVVHGNSSVLDAAVTLLDGRDGRTIDETELPGALRRPTVWPSEEADSPHLLFVPTSDTSALVMQIRSGNISLQRVIDLGRAIADAHPLRLVADDPSTQLLVRTREGGLHLFDRDFRLLASLPTPGQLHHAQAPLLFRVHDDVPRLFAPSSAGWIVRAVRAADPPKHWAWISAVAALGSFGAYAWWRRQRRNAARGVRLPATQARRQLLDALELAGHGAIGALQGLRRLSWHLRAREAGLGQEADAAQRLHAMIDETLERTLPALRDDLALVDAADLDGFDTARVVRPLDDLQRALPVLRASTLQDSTAAEASHAPTRAVIDAAQRAENELQALRRALEERVSAKLLHCLDRVRDALADRFAEHGVEVIVASTEDVACRIEADELEFVLENLMSNAVRAMEGAPVRRLEITWKVENGLVVLDVTDTGAGIAEDDRERIVESRYTQREGGGAGLVRSSGMLRRYGGRIYVAESEAGRGTRMRVEVGGGTEQQY